MPINKKKGSPRYGRRYTVGKGGAHIYKGRGGKRIVIGGKRKPGKPVDPYKSEVDAAVNLEFGETDQQLDRERRISGQATRNVGSWWDGYKADVETARQRTAAGYKEAQQGVYGQANTARAQDQTQAAQMDAGAQQAAALRGATAGPNVGAQAQAARQALSSSFGGMIGSQGATQNAYQADQFRIGGGIRALELGKEAGRGRLIEEEARKVSVKKGAYRVAKRQELEEARFKKRLEILTFEGKEAAEAFDQQFKVAQQRQTAADKRAARGLTKRGQNVTRRGQDLTNQRTIRGQDLTDQRARDKAAGGGGSKGGKGKKGTGRRHAGYGATNVSLPVAVTNRKAWTDLVADSKRVNRVPKKAKGYMRTVLEEYAGGRGKVSKATALKVYRTYGFRLPYKKAKKKLTKKDVDRAFGPLNKVLKGL